VSSRIRIVCRAPDGPEVPRGELPLINGLPPGLSDCAIYAVGNDGAQVQLTNVERVVWIVGPGEPARAVVTFLDVDIDADAVGDLVP
jgi:hypothetical protein